MRLWKKVSSLILAVALCFCLLPVQAADADGDQGSSGSSPVFRSFKSLPLTLQSNQVGISVNTTRTDAYSGDVISFEVVMDPVQNLGTLQLVLDIPEGLSYVPDSACVPDDLKTTLGFDELAFTELSLMLNGYASAGNYSAEAETLLLTFDCRADDTVTAQATVNVSLTNLEFYSIGGDEEDWLDLTDSFEVIPAPLTLHPGTHTHSYTGTVTTPASCTTAGIKTYVCACGERYTEDVPALGHTWDDGVITTEPTTTTEGVKTFTCEVCHETKTEAVPMLEEIPEDAAKLVITSKTVLLGDNVVVEFTAQNVGLVKSIGLLDLTYDHDALELIASETGWTITNAAMKDWNEEEGGVLAFNANTEVDGVIFKAVFHVKDDAEVGDYTVSVNGLFKMMVGSVIEADMDVYNIPGILTVIDVLPGDVNGDGYVNSNDAIYLLRSTFSPDRYPVNQDCDFNGDDYVNSNDAIYLLRHTFNAERYPLQ